MHRPRLVQSQTDRPVLRFQLRGESGPVPAPFADHHQKNKSGQADPAENSLFPRSSRRAARCAFSGAARRGFIRTIMDTTTNRATSSITPSNSVLADLPPVERDGHGEGWKPTCLPGRLPTPSAPGRSGPFDSGRPGRCRQRGRLRHLHAERSKMRRANSISFVDICSKGSAFLVATR